MGLKLKDIKYETLNASSISPETPTSDRRRLSPLAAQRKALEMVYSRRAVVTHPNALVIHAQEIQGPATYTNRLGLLQAQSMAGGAEGDTSPQQVGTWEYKVRMNASDACMPIPQSGTDRSLRSEVTVYSALPYPVPVGSLVTIQYEDPANNINPRIVKMHGQVAIKNVEGSANTNTAPLGSAYSAGTPRPLRSPPANSAGDMSCPSFNLPSEEANSLDMTYVHGSDYQTGVQLHQNNWDNPPENPVSGWALPLKPSEATASKVPGSLRAPSGINRSRGKKAFHKAIDLSAKTGTPLYAVANATVTISRPICFKGKRPSTNGNRITYKTDTGYTITYIHLDMPSPLKVGDKITKGQLVGYVGDTGISQGAHLHFMVQKGSQILHPGDFYPPEWITMAGTTSPVTAVNRRSIPTVHVPTKETT